MANYTAADVKKLRELTAAGMMDCKNALVEAEGDFDKAADILRVKGLKGVAKREGRSASNGLVAAELDGTASGVLLELACETDFVAKGERFQQVAARLVSHVASTSPADLEAYLASELEAGTTVQSFVDEANATLGEKIEVRRFAQFGGEGKYVAAYLHKTSPDLPAQVGVLVELSGSGDLAPVAKSLAQHIAALPPTYVTRDEVPADVIENERRLAAEKAKEDGKPEQAIDRIVESTVNSYFKDNVLLEQSTAQDQKKTVKSVLEAEGATVHRFARFRVGS